MLRYARLMPADWHLLSLQLESRQRAVAASAAFKAGAEALSVRPAPAEANNSRTEIQCQGLGSVPNSKLV